ncbi:MAG: 30S ribosome-binding factor RbfA [Tissierellia bacterium]|nr:30S ribosome-binding factor RbfA [Tissierellia bacterium]
MDRKRTARISEEIKKVIASSILNDLKDPRIANLTSVTNVELSNDGSYCKIYISVMGNEEEKANTIEGLNNAKGFLKRQISKNIDLRIIPDLNIIQDESIEESMNLFKLIDEVNEKNDE